MRDDCVSSGALCEDTSATAPGSNIKLNTAHFVKLSPFHSPEDGEEGGSHEVTGGWRGLLRGSLQSVFANDNRCKLASNRALGGYCEQYPPNARLLTNLQRLSFASFTLQLPLQQTSPSPWPPTFPLPLHPLDEEGGPIKRHIRDFGYYERAPSAGRILVQLPPLNFVGKGSDAYQTRCRDTNAYFV